MNKMIMTSDTLEVFGDYGNYKIKESDKGGFLINAVFDSFVNERDETGDTYLVEKGEYWKIRVDGIQGLHSFITACENTKLWNVLKGIAYRIGIDSEKGIMYIRGASRNYILGEEGGKLYLDETKDQKTHHYLPGLDAALSEIVRSDTWWLRSLDEIIEITDRQYNIMEITDGGHIRLPLKNETAILGQKEDGSYWISIEGGDHHVYYRDTLKEIFKLICAGGKAT